MLTEPLWGLPYNLYAPFASVYMLAIGVSESGIGTIATFTLGLQVIFSLLGGPITDKLGRKRATFIFDFLSWSVPAILWATARSAAWFYLAAMFNALVRVPMTSWTCLFIEDAPKERVVHYWAWVHVAGIVAGVVTPVAGLLIDRFSLIPTMRAIYLFAFVSMTSKFFILNAISTETRQGKVRMEATKHTPFSLLFRESVRMFRPIFTTSGTLAVIVLLSMNSIYITVRSAFFGVLLTEGMKFAPHLLGWFAALRSVVILAFFFVVLPRLRTDRTERYVFIGLTAITSALILLIVIPGRNMALVAVSVFVESCGVALLAPHLEGFVYAAIDPEERARILAVANTVVLAVASPFGWIAGQLSEIAQILPFVLIIAIIVGVGVFLVLRHRGRGLRTTVRPGR